MDIDGFWSLVAASRQGLARDDPDGNRERQAEALERLLQKLPPTEIAAFDGHLTDLLFRAYTWDLWGAAYVIHGGCSDDSFMDFRAWLISMGRAIYEKALADPESLRGPAADAESCMFEEFAYIPAEVYKAATGQKLPETGKVHPAEPSGKEWSEDDDDELERRFPKLWERFSDDPL